MRCLALMANLLGYHRRPVARIARLLQELFRVVGPELAHVRIGIDIRIDEPTVLLLHFADVDVADDVAVLVERDRSAQRLHPYAAQRLDEGLLVLHLALERLERRVEYFPVEVGARRVLARIVAVLRAMGSYEAVVDRVAELRGGPAS